VAADLSQPYQLRIPGARDAASARQQLEVAARAAVDPGIGRRLLELLVAKSVSHRGGDLCAVSAVSMSQLGTALRKAVGEQEAYKLAEVVGRLAQYVERTKPGPGNQLVRLRAGALLAAQPPAPAQETTSKRSAAESSATGSAAGAAGGNAGHGHGHGAGSRSASDTDHGAPAVFLPSYLAKAAAKPWRWGDIQLGALPGQRPVLPLLMCLTRVFHCCCCCCCYCAAAAGGATAKAAQRGKSGRLGAPASSLRLPFPPGTHLSGRPE
jgi:hypothetical protein